MHDFVANCGDCSAHFYGCQWVIICGVNKIPYSFRRWKNIQIKLDSIEASQKANTKILASKKYLTTNYTIVIVCVDIISSAQKKWYPL